VNALSEWLRLTIRRDGQTHFMEFRRGEALAPLKVIGKTERRGTEVHFLADAETFGHVEYHYDILAKRLRELSFLNNGVRIVLVDQRAGKEEEFSFAGGVRGFVDYKGEALDIGFNVQYLLDVLNNLAVEAVQVSLGDANSSALITVPGRDDFKYVVMPMRI